PRLSDRRRVPGNRRPLAAPVITGSVCPSSRCGRLARPTRRDRAMALRCTVAAWRPGMVLAGLLAATTAAQALGPDLSGTWWDPARGGEGQMLSFEQHAGSHYAVLAWMSYDDAGAPLWLIGSAPYTPGDNRVRIALGRARGARFGSAF